MNLAFETTGRTAGAGDDWLVGVQGKVVIANCGGILVEALDTKISELNRIVVEGRFLGSAVAIAGRVGVRHRMEIG
jgi:hypothetical protein